ncbi:hypothetical protein [Paracoccus laeviglucosivorans]|uniref:Uncharacterized protein n=1 Tax=Paracoccus laeviglucosivorans TaxID=1197861 RepID=A0A521EVE7_9RHOB|nr:hypothetical protein [Paracoccus laeviglucosivorans]SMO87884.1 hypothetical protein SAMN06265221_1162 [Paracoccus laeviglucosivorans]
MARILAVFLILLAHPALAGPWPREEGGVFLSFSGERDRDGNSYAGLYTEYGLSPRTTLGLELGRANAGETNVMIWWQRALDRGQGANRFTISSGLGAVQRDGEVMPVAQMGAAWGRGLDGLPLLQHIPGGGWLAVEGRVKVAGATETARIDQGLTSVEIAYLTPETTTKAEVTLGLRPFDRLMLINQFRFEKREDTGFSSKLATSVVRDLWGPAKVELGVITPLSGQGEEAVKLGTWFEF